MSRADGKSASVEFLDGNPHGSSFRRIESQVSELDRKLSNLARTWDTLSSTSLTKGCWACLGTGQSGINSADEEWSSIKPHLPLPQRGATLARPTFAWRPTRSNICSTPEASGGNFSLISTLCDDPVLFQSWYRNGTLARMMEYPTPTFFSITICFYVFRPDFWVLHFRRSVSFATAPLNPIGLSGQRESQVPADAFHVWFRL